MRTRALLLMMMGSIVVLPAIPEAEAAGTEHATIANFSFSPNPVKIPLGATLQWTNTDGTAHTVTADDGSFGSKPFSTSKSATLTVPTSPGSYAFHCKIHPTMHGTLVVQ